MRRTFLLVIEGAKKNLALSLLKQNIEEAVSRAPDNGNSTLSKSEEAVPGATDNDNFTFIKLEEDVGEAQASFKEEKTPGKSISDIVEVQMKEIKDKVVHFEDIELHMQKEWRTNCRI